MKLKTKGKTIWLFHHYADPPEGHWTNHYYLFEEMVRKNYNVTIYSSSFSHYNRRDNYLKKGDTVKAKVYNGVQFIFLRTLPYFKNNWRRYGNFLSYSMKVFYVALRNKDRPDLIIGSSPHLFCAFAAYLVARQKSVPFYFEVHDLWPQFFVELGAFSEGHPVVRGLRWMEKHLYQKADKILPLWPRMNLYFQQFGIPRDKIVWLPMGIKLAKINNSNRLSDKIKAEFLVMYLGRFGLTQDMETILRTAKIIQKAGIQNIKFELVGGGPEKDELIKKAQKFNLSNTRFHDFLPQSQMHEYMKRADVLIGGSPDLAHFGKYGHISTKILEYLLSGRPIVFAANDKNHLVANVNAGLVVPPNNPEAMKDAIIEIAALSADERSKLGENGIRYVRENHNINTIAAKLETLIENYKI
jgi:glycosyltransferase involved in cell wall biosynthesis